MSLIGRAAAQMVTAVSVLCLATHIAMLLTVEPAQRGTGAAMLLLSLACVILHGRLLVVAGAGATMVLGHLAIVHRLGPSAQPSGVVPDLLMHAGVSLGGAMAGLAVVGLLARPAGARPST